MEKIKQKIWYFLQLIIAFGLIIFILLQVDREKFLVYFSGLELQRFLVIIPFSIIGLYVQFLRWKYLVNSYSAHFENRDLIPSFFAGFALRLLVPGGHAEISKIYLLPGKKRGKAIAFGMERFFQTLIKVFLITLVIPLHFRKYTLPAVILLLGLVVLYLIFPRLSIFNRLREKEVNHHRVFLMNLLYSLILFIIMTTQYFILLNGVYPISFSDTGQTVVFLWGAGVIPISISGLGIREGLAAFFLAKHGFDPAYAVATSLFLFTLNNIIPALTGGYYLYRRRTHFSEIRDTWQQTRQFWRNFKNGSDNNSLTKE
jgi:uncharacterized membrane protein YbhN (UPF0104 family)